MQDSPRLWVRSALKLCENEAGLGRSAHDPDNRTILPDDIHSAVNAKILAGMVNRALMGAGIGVSDPQMWGLRQQKHNDKGDQRKRRQQRNQDYRFAS